MTGLNKSFVVYNKGEINQTIIINPKIDSILKIIKENFYSGKIISALKSLQELIDSYSEIEATIFQLLKLKAHFLLALHKIEDYIQKIEYLEKFSNYHDNDFKQLKLYYYLIKKDDDLFFKTADELNHLTGKQKEFFDLLFYINNDSNKAIEIYEKYFINDETAEILFMGAFSYLNNVSKFSIFDPNSFYLKHLELYKKCLSRIEINNNIEKLQYLLNASVIPINFNLNNITGSQCPVELSLIDELIETVEQFGDNIKEFEVTNIKHIINQYLVALSLNNNNNNNNNKTTFINTASEYSRFLTTENFLQYHSNNNDLTDDVVLKKFKSTNDYNIIFLYTRSLFYDDKKLTIDFININCLYNSDHILCFEFYFLAEIFLNQNLKEDFIQALKIHKDDSIDHLRLYLKIYNTLKKEIPDNEFKTLFELSKENDISYNHLLSCIKLFFDADHWWYGFELSLNKKNIYPSITQETIIYCSNPEITLPIHDFEKYISMLGNDKYNNENYIGLIYHNFQNFRKAFEYYYICWKKEKVYNLAANIFSCLMAIKPITGLNSDEESALEESVAFIESNNDLDNFKTILNIVHYFIEKKDYSKGFKLFNKSILRRDLNSFNQEEIDNISSFFQSTTNDYKFYDDITNIYINHEGNFLIYNGYEISESVKTIFNFKNENDLKLKLLRKEELQKNQDTLKEETKIQCLSSLIIFFFLKKSSNCISFPIDESFKSDPLSFLDNILKPYHDYKENSMSSLAEERIITFFQMESDYLKFPDLIDTLLKRDDLIFFSGYNIPQNMPKLLTISSIFFLESINFLKESINNQPDIYIQKSVFKFFFDHYDKSGMFDNIIKVLLKFEKNGKIIDDSTVSPLYISITKLREPFGVLDYNAICLGLHGKIQIISDDPSLLKIFGNISGFILPTNSIFLIYRYLAGKDNKDIEMNKIITELHSLKYKYILPFKSIEQLRFFYNNKDLMLLESVRTMVKIAEDYHWLNDDFENGSPVKLDETIPI